MTAEKYKQLKEKSKGDNLMLCYQIFCERKQYIPYDVFISLFPQWLITQQPDVFVMVNGDMRQLTKIGVDKIINDLNKQYNV